MKKLILLILTSISVICLAACNTGNTDVNSTTDAVTLQNTLSATQGVGQIKGMELSEDQEEIYSLLTNVYQSAYIYEYSSGYTKLKLWLDIYKDGKKKITSESMDAYNLEAGQPGRICIHEDSEDGFEWSFTVQTGSGTFRAEKITTYEDIEISGWGFTDMNEPVDITPGEDIILGCKVFSEGGFHTLELHEMEQPEYLQQYPYVVVFKCRFD